MDTSTYPEHRILILINILKYILILIVFQYFFFDLPTSFSIFLLPQKSIKQNLSSHKAKLILKTGAGILIFYSQTSATPTFGGMLVATCFVNRMTKVKKHVFCFANRRQKDPILELFNKKHPASHFVNRKPLAMLALRHPPREANPFLKDLPAQAQSQNQAWSIVSEGRFDSSPLFLWQVWGL